MRLAIRSMLVALLSVTGASAQPDTKEVAEIQSIYSAQSTGFVALKGKPLSTDSSGRSVSQGTVSLAGLNCRLIEDEKYGPRGNLYECNNEGWPVQPSSASDPTGEKTYEEIKQAFDAAVPGLQWFNVGNRGTAKFAGTDKSNATVDLRLMGGPSGSVVSITFSANPFHPGDKD